MKSVKIKQNLFYFFKSTYSGSHYGAPFCMTRPLDHTSSNDDRNSAEDSLYRKMIASFWSMMIKKVFFIVTFYCVFLRKSFACRTFLVIQISHVFCNPHNFCLESKVLRAYSEINKAWNNMLSHGRTRTETVLYEIRNTLSSPNCELKA